MIWDVLESLLSGIKFGDNIDFNMGFIFIMDYVN